MGDGLLFLSRHTWRLQNWFPRGWQTVSLMVTPKAYRDPLTGVSTRASLIERLQNEVARARRYNEPFSVLMLDLDYFKSINDAFGHLRGDEVLVQFTMRLKKMLRGADLIFRYGGDEFVLLLPNTDKVHAGVVARRLLHDTITIPFVGDPPVSLALSIGVANYPEDAQTSAALLEIADQRHYQAKRNGRGQVVDKESRQSTTLVLDPPDRLIERDRPLGVLMDFLRQLKHTARGMFLISAGSGMGKTRFLAETRRLARLQGQVILELSGKSALKNRRFGAFMEASWPWQIDASLLLKVNEFGHLLKTWMEHKGDHGLVIAVDDLHELDSASLNFLQELFYVPDLPQIALVGAVDEVFARTLDLDAPIRSDVHLVPISYEGVRVWLRQTLQWEPPRDFLGWFYAETSGRPAEIQMTLTHMIESGLLTRRGDEWDYQPDLSMLPVSDWLHAQRTHSLNYQPADTTDFIGRVAELHEIKLKLKDTQVIALIGPPGVGKSRLALQVVLEESDSYPHGYLVVDFSRHRHEDTLLAEMGQALHLAVESIPVTRMRVFDKLRDRQQLLVLDGYQPGTYQARFVTDILRAAPESKLIITAIDDSELADFKPISIGGILAPTDDTSIATESYDAIQLFLSCLRENTPGYNLSAPDLPYVTRIIRLLDGSPLGIELAAAWVPAFYPHEIAAELERRSLHFHTQEKQPTNVTDTGLRVLFETFWFMLSEPEQAILKRMSVFVGNFSNQAARRIAGASPFFLDAIVAKSFIRRMPDGTYLFRDRLKQLIARLLQENQEEYTHIRDAHTHYYLSMVGERVESHASSPSWLAMNDLLQELWNIRTAWEWAVESQAVEILVQSGFAMCQLYSLAGWVDEGRRVLTAAVQATSGDARFLDALGDCLSQFDSLQATAN